MSKMIMLSSHYHNINQSRMEIINWKILHSRKRPHNLLARSPGSWANADDKSSLSRLKIYIFSLKPEI